MFRKKEHTYFFWVFLPMWIGFGGGLEKCQCGGRPYSHGMRQILYARSIFGFFYHIFVHYCLFLDHFSSKHINQLHIVNL
jgi:hypothetical protein